MVCLRQAGVPATSTPETCYTPDPYNSDGKGLGYYEFLNVPNNSLHIVTPVSPGFQFDKPARTVKIANDQVAQIDGQPAGASPVVDFATVLTVSGQCGASNGLTLTQAPASGFCNAGTPTAVTGTGPWTWSCAGSGGGSNASCNAYLQGVLVNGACGSSNNGTFTQAPSSGLCDAGTPSAVTGTGPWTWSCQGANNGTTASCQASSSPTPPPVNGYTSLVSGSDVRNNSIAPNGEAFYQFTVDAAHAGHAPTVQLISTDGTTVQMLVVKKGLPLVTRAEFDNYWNSFIGGGSSIGVGPQYWFRLSNGGSYSSIASTIYNAQPDTYSVVVVNKSAKAGSYRITLYIP
jgi:hypothetical protein